MGVRERDMHDVLIDSSISSQQIPPKWKVGSKRD